MKNFTIASTRTTPEISFDVTWGTLNIVGVSIPENPGEFYANLFEAIAEYAKNPKQVTTINFKLNYFNSSSSRTLLKIINTFKKLESKTRTLINWYYDKADEEQLETIKDLESLGGISFNFIGV